jgi:putative aldouronate transport system permease protein
LGELKKRESGFGKVKILYLMIFPAILYFIILTYFPVMDGLKMSFQNVRLMGENRFVGWDNYLKMFKTPGFKTVFTNTLILGLSNVILTAFIPMFIALSLNEIRLTSAKRLFQSILYMPHLFSWVVVGGIWIFILSPDAGLINSIRNLFGLDSIYFLVKQDYARGLMIGVNLWKQAGYVCILYLATIAGINPELYEAAVIDGANAWHKTLYITIPELLRTLKVVLLLNLMGALRIFDQIYVMRNEVTAPKLDVLMYYVYTHGLEKFNIGYASAISVFIFLLTLIVTLIVRRVIKYSV